MQQRHDDGRAIRVHLESQARRGNAEAIALLRAPDFPVVFGYLFDWYAEFLLWHGGEHAPSWSDWHGWATLMQHTVTPWDLRVLRRIHDAHYSLSSAQGKASHGR